MNVEEDYNEYCRSHPEADVELKTSAILKNMKIRLDDSIPVGKIILLRKNQHAKFMEGPTRT